MGDYDGIWRPEREVSGAWIATRYVDYGPQLNNRYERQRDTVMKGGLDVPNYHDTMGPCEDRCRVLNSSARSRPRKPGS